LGIVVAVVVVAAAAVVELVLVECRDEYVVTIERFDVGSSLYLVRERISRIGKFQRNVSTFTSFNKRSQRLYRGGRLLRIEGGVVAAKICGFVGIVALLMSVGWIAETRD
jgi:hypothetical protein